MQEYGKEKEFPQKSRAIPAKKIKRDRIYSPYAPVSRNTCFFCCNFSPKLYGDARRLIGQNVSVIRARKD